MEDIVNLARAAKRRLKSNFWAECKKTLDENAESAKLSGVSEIKARSHFSEKVKSKISGEKDDSFYLKVKAILDAEGEVSDAIGRLTDREVYDALSYEEKQRYTLELSAKYLAAVKKYRSEKEHGI